MRTALPGLLPARPRPDLRSDWLLVSCQVTKSMKAGCKMQLNHPRRFAGGPQGPRASLGPFAFLSHSDSSASALGSQRDGLVQYSFLVPDPNACAFSIATSATLDSQRRGSRREHLQHSFDGIARGRLQNKLALRFRDCLLDWLSIRGLLDSPAD